MMKPPKFFLSYSHKDIEAVKIIARVLMIHGLKTWQDISNLGSGLTEDEIRKAIQEDCAGLIFYSTSDSLKAPMVRTVELKTAEEKYLKDKTFHIVPVFYATIEESNTALQGYLKTKISDFNGAIIKDGNVIEASQRSALLALKNLNLPSGIVPIGIASYQKTSSEVLLDLDFTHYFASGLPDAETWENEFMPAFIALKDALLEKHKKHLRIIAHAHLSLGFAFGYVFRDRTGFVLEIEQINKPMRELWSTETKEEQNPLKIDCTPVTNFDAKDILVNINVVSNDSNSLEAFIKKSGLQYRAFIEAKPLSYPFFISNGQAIAIAHELVKKIKEAHGEYGTNTVHLFAAIPLGLAVIIGHHLNACGKIQCYEFDKAKREYIPSVMLENY